MAGIAKRTGWRKALYTLGIVLGLGLLAQQTWQGTMALQQAQACVVRPSYLMATVALYTLAYFMQMAAWALIMRSLHAPLSVQAVVKGYTLSFLPRYIPGSVWGYLSRNEWLAQMHNVRYGVSTTASLLEAAMLLITAVLLGALYGLLNGLPAEWLPTTGQFLAPNPGVNQGILRMVIVGVVIVGVGIAATWGAWRMLPWLVTHLARKRVQIDPQQQTPTPIRLRLWPATTALYVGFWVLQGAALLAIAQSLCGGLTLGLDVAVAASALSWAIGFLILFVPAGLGVREWTLGTLLVTFATLQPGQATLIAVVSRFGMIVAELLVLGIGIHGQFQSWWKRRAWVIEDGSLEQTNRKQTNHE